MTDEVDADHGRRVRRLERRLERERAARAESERIAEDALRRMYEANELKTVLLGTISHELRTPATILRGLAGHLAAQWEELDDDGRRALVGRLVDNAEHLAELVERVLELARLERGAIDGTAHDLRLASWLPELEREWNLMSPDHVVRVEVAEDAVVRCHPTALRQILTNLVSNAQRYAPSGTTVRVRAGRDDEQVVLQVLDEGPGVAPEDRLRIFEPFYRGAGDHVTRTSGFGIGLTVVQRLAGLVGAVVHVQDGGTGGADFRVRFDAAG